MPLYPIFFVFVFIFGTVAAIFRGPIWGLLLYVFVYYNIPAFQWWGRYVPDLRWSFTTAGILLVSCVIHSRQLASSKSSMNIPLKILILLLLLMTAIVPISYDSEISGNRVYDFFRYVLMFYLVGRILTDFKQYQQYMLTIVICSTYLFWTAHSYFTGTRLDGVGLPDANDANFFAILIILIIPMMVAVALTGKMWQRAIALIGIPLAINAFAMTRSRGGFIGVLVQLIVVIILFRKSKHRKKIIAGIVCIVVLFGVLMDDQFKSRLLNLRDSVSEGESSGASAGRVTIWKHGFNMARDYPFGAGGGAFMVLSPQYLPSERLSSTGQRASHNTYLLMLVEGGLIGLLLYLGFMFFIMAAAYKTLTIKNTAGGESEMQVLNLHVTMLIISLSGFWTASFFGDRIYFEGFYLIAALAPILLKIGRQVSSLQNIEGTTDSLSQNDR